MADTSTVFLVGFILFFVESGVVFLTYLYYIWRGRITKEQYACHADLFCTKWTNTRWIYPILFIALLFMGILYLAFYLGGGIFFRTGTLQVMWLRWLILAIVAFLYAYCLNYIMTITGKSNDEQAFFSVFLYTFAYIALWGATWSPDYAIRLMSAIFSIVLFLLSLFFYVYPDNKFDCVYHISSKFPYHKVFFAFIVLAYVYYMIIYFLSESNGFSSVLAFQAEAIAYLVGDVLFILLFAVIVVIATFVNLKDTLRVVNKKTGQFSFASPVKQKTLL